MTPPVDAYIENVTPPVDAYIENHGSVFLVRPASESARHWIEDHVSDEASFFGTALVVEHRYIIDLAAGMQEDGLVLA